MNGQPEYSDGVKDERARCESICEMWKTSAYIATRYGQIDDAGMRVLLRVIALLEEDIQSGRLPGRS